MEEDKTPLAIFTSDCHFDEKKYVCRKENDWIEYQKGVMLWLTDMCEKYSVPCIVVGDLVNRSRHSNELVNLIIDNMPHSYITAGNHCLPYHSKELEHRSAYGSIIRSDKFMELNEPLEIHKGMTIYPFHFGEEYYDCPKKDGFNILIGHELIWEGREPFDGAPKKGNVEEIVKRAKGYDLCIFGDNHQFFMTEVGETTILNNGSLMRISSDQKDYQPFVHLLYSDGSIEHIEVPVEDDMISTDHLDTKKEVAQKIDGFVDRLKKSDDLPELSFEERVMRAIVENEIDVQVKEIIIEEIEKIG